VGAAWGAGATPTVIAIVEAKLKYGVAEERQAAIEMLSRLLPSAVAEHAATVVQTLADEDADVRHAALATLGKVERAIAGGKV
jgi:HEAT repeat protein